MLSNLLILLGITNRIVSFSHTCFPERLLQLCMHCQDDFLLICPGIGISFSLYTFIIKENYNQFNSLLLFCFIVSYQISLETKGKYLFGLGNKNFSYLLLLLGTFRSPVITRRENWNTWQEASFSWPMHSPFNALFSSKPRPRCFSCGGH